MATMAFQGVPRGAKKKSRRARKKRASRLVATGAAPKDYEGTSGLFYGAVKYDLGFN